MLNEPFFSSPTKTGTLGGLLTVLLVNIQSGDVIRTMVLAAIGASVSLAVSILWKLIARKWRH